MHAASLIYGTILICLGLVFGGGYLLYRMQKKSQRDAEQLQVQLADLAHEINSSLAVLKTSAEFFLAETTTQPTELHEILKNSIHDVDRIARAMEDLVRLVNFDSDMRLVLRQKLDLGLLAKKVVAEMAPVAQKKGFEIVYSAQQPAWITGSATELEEMLRGLLKNALVHQAGNGNIALTVAPVGGRVELTLTPAAGQLGPQQMLDLMEHFIHRRDRGEPDPRYSGLTMILAKKIILWHGAKLSALEHGPHATVLKIIFKP